MRAWCNVISIILWYVSLSFFMMYLTHLRAILFTAFYCISFPCDNNISDSAKACHMAWLDINVITCQSRYYNMCCLMSTQECSLLSTIASHWLFMYSSHEENSALEKELKVDNSLNSIGLSVRVSCWWKGDWY